MARYDRLVGERAISDKPECRASLERLLVLLVRNGGPLPQLTATISEGVEVQWLVHDDLVALIVGDNGDWILWSEDRQNRELFEREGRNGVAPPTSVVRAAAKQLALMGQVLTEIGPQPPQPQGTG